MPTYAYKCEECDTKFEYFHKTQENIEDVNCPTCNSTSLKKLVTSANFNGFNTKLSPIPAMCESGGSCANGACPYAG